MYFHNSIPTRYRGNRILFSTNLRLRFLHRVSFLVVVSLESWLVSSFALLLFGCFHCSFVALVVNDVVRLQKKSPSLIAGTLLRMEFRDMMGEVVFVLQEAKRRPKLNRIGLPEYMETVDGADVHETTGPIYIYSMKVFNVGFSMICEKNHQASQPRQPDTKLTPVQGCTSHTFTNPHLPPFL